MAPHNGAMRLLSHEKNAEVMSTAHITVQCDSSLTKFTLSAETTKTGKLSNFLSRHLKRFSAQALILRFVVRQSEILRTVIAPFYRSLSVSAGWYLTTSLEHTLFHNFFSYSNTLTVQKENKISSGSIEAHTVTIFSPK
jgi:hypothetical protein